MTPMQRGDVGSILVVYLEDRNGRALVRLPNGSKTSLPHDSLDFVVSSDGLERPVPGDDLTRGALPEPPRRRTDAGWLCASPMTSASPVVAQRVGRSRLRQPRCRGRQG